MTEMSDICLHHFGTFHGRDLKGDQFISVVERGYHPGGNELEYDGIPGMLPAKYGAVKAVHHSIAKKYITPDGLPCPVGDKKCNKISASAGSIAPEGNHDGTSKNNPAEYHVQHLIGKYRRKIKYLEENTA